MKTMPITNSVIEKYRKQAKRDNNIPEDVLRVRLNCLYWCGVKRTSNVSQFYDFVITVNSNIISNIYWTDEVMELNATQIKQLKRMYYQNGLNSRGTRFVNRNEN